MVCKLSDLKEAEKGTEKSLYKASLQLKHVDFRLSHGALPRGRISVGHLSCSTNYTLIQFDNVDWGSGWTADFIMFSNSTGEIVSHLDFSVIIEDVFGNVYKEQLSRSWLAKKVGFLICNTYQIVGNE